MTDIYVANDPYNWFNRLDEMESDIKDIASQGDLESILESVKNYFIKKDYEIKKALERDGQYRYIFYNKNLDESIVFIMEEELQLNYLSLAIHKETIDSLENYNTIDNPNEFFSMFI